MSQSSEKDLPTAAIRNHAAGIKAFRRGVRAALLEHKRAGNPVAIWQDGKVVWVAPEDIVLPPEPSEETTDS